MRSFKSLTDLNQLPTTDPAYPLVKNLIEACIVFDGYDPDADGWIVLIDEGDIDQPLTGDRLHPVCSPAKEDDPFSLGVIGTERSPLLQHVWVEPRTPNAEGNYTEILFCVPCSYSYEGHPRLVITQGFTIILTEEAHRVLAPER